MFTQGDVDKRGVKIMREGKPARLRISVKAIS